MEPLFGRAAYCWPWQLLAWGSSKKVDCTMLFGFIFFKHSFVMVGSFPQEEITTKKKNFSPCCEQEICPFISGGLSWESPDAYRSKPFGVCFHDFGPLFRPNVSAFDSDNGPNDNALLQKKSFGFALPVPRILNRQRLRWDEENWLFVVSFWPFGAFKRFFRVNISHGKGWYLTVFTRSGSEIRKQEDTVVPASLCKCEHLGNWFFLCRKHSGVEHKEATSI